jgi:hypothetical protein
MPGGEITYKRAEKRWLIGKQERKVHKLNKKLPIKEIKEQFL